MSFSFRLQAVLSLAAAVITSLSGCTARAIPDLSPFEQSTRQLHKSVKLSLEGPIQSARDMSETLSAAAEKANEPRKSSLTGYASQYAEMSTALAARQAYFDGAIKAFAAYAKELQTIADTARDQIDDAKAYAGAFNSLIDTVAGLVPVPASPVIGAGLTTLVSAAQSLQASIIREQTRRSLLAEVQDHTPEVNALVTALITDLKLARDGLSTRSAAATAAAWELYNTEHTTLNKARGLRFERAEAMFKPWPPAASTVADFIAAGEAVRTAEHMHEPADALITQLRLDVERSTALLNDTLGLVSAWSNAHEKLPETINKGRVSELQALADSAKELSALIASLKKTYLKLQGV